jgi:hypothetical protein
MPAPHSQPSGPARQGLSGWSSQTHPTSSHAAHFIRNKIACPAQNPTIPSGLTAVPGVFSWRMGSKTRGESLAFAISFALIRACKVVRGLRQGLTEDERLAVADDAVEEMKRYGDPWRLNEDNPPWTGAGPAQSSMQGKP